MPRNAHEGRRGFIWLPREDSLTWSVTINGEDVTTDIISSEVMRGVCPEIGEFKISLINTDSAYNDKFSKGQTFLLKMDFSDGSTTRFNGKIDRIQNVYSLNMGYVLELKGGHITSSLLDVRVTESYDGSSTITEIIEDLIATYLTGYTSNITATSTTTPTINWDEKPFWDCIFDLCKIADADAYLSDASIINFFDRESVENNDEAIVWNDTLIELQGLGTQTLTTKNKIRVYGDDGTGLPVISTVNDLTSQSSYGIKELTLFDTSTTTTEEGDSIGNAELSENANPKDEGEASALILPSLQPGDYIWITNPPIGITGQYRVYKYIHSFPNERTTAVIGKERKMPHVIKKRIEKELALQTITNPYKMSGSLNYPYDNENDIASKDSNVSITNGKVTLSSGSQGVITHSTSTLSSDITSVHLLAVGNNLVGTTFELSVDGGVTYETINLNNLTELTYTGNLVVLKITIQSSSTEIDSVAVLYK